MSATNNILFETQYFPTIEFFKRASQYSILFLEAKENYQKGGYRNRCQIAGPNGIHRLSVPLEKGKNNKAPIRDVKISNIDRWQKIHWNSIQTAYGKSPFFEYYQDELKPIFEKEWTYLFDLNLNIIETLTPILQLSFDIRLTVEYKKTYELLVDDFREKISPNTTPFDNYTSPKYHQVFEAKNGFLSNLSILDLLFCVGPEAYFHLSE